jgi:hypothetical protein
VADPLTVIVTAHAQEQLEALGPPAELAIEWLRGMGIDDISWMAEPLPAQHGRQMWLLWADGVRVLFDVEDSDLTVHGVGLRPRSRAPRRRSRAEPG